MSDPGDAGYYGVDAAVLEKDAVSLAQQAVQNDKNGCFQTAIFYYSEAAQALMSASLAGSRIPNILDKANEYMIRAETIKTALSNQNGSDEPAIQIKNTQQTKLERAQFLIHQAFDEDEGGNKEEAIQLYSQAVELCIEIRNTAADNTQLQNRVTKLATQALDRAENLKKENRLSPTNIGNTSEKTGASRPIPPLGFGAFLDSDDDNKQRQTNSIPKSPTPSRSSRVRNVGSAGYTKEEIEVLRKTSFINGREYVPFMAVDAKERFAYPVSFSDRSGKLAVSPKQKQDFGRWARPEEFCDNPQILYAVSSFSIKQADLVYLIRKVLTDSKDPSHQSHELQTIVSDCSFVASLAIAAQYERRFKKKLITSIIYPQNRNAEPVYNPCGKYMVKLNLNGVARKVIIDDFLPLSRGGQLLCSFSNNKNELWVSLLEKSYMKVMGGYDFPGSNSNIDLHALSGWIPERVAIRMESPDFNRDKEFQRLLDRFHKGHCLVTIATGDIPEAEADRAGLVPTHAYAMLDIREVKGRQLFMLKNPWSHLRWKGNYSEKDTVHWSPELQKLLNYDPQSAQMVDNGVFWIDYDSICKFYDVIYINWNPELFSHTTCVHQSWLAKEGPKKDTYNISDNPQYRLEIKTNQPSAVWILLTRHITDKEDFANNREFITVVVYKNGGQKVFYPYDPKPYKDGVRINSPHYLCKLVEDKGHQVYSLVISQYEKNSTIHFTLRVYATCEFSLTKFADPYKKQYDKRITGEWNDRTAGGCSNYPDTCQNNPIYQVHINNNNTDNYLMVELLGPKQYSVGFSVLAVSETVPSSAGAPKKKTSGDLRPGYCVMQLEAISGGVYNVTPFTFKPAQKGNFFLDLSCSTAFTVSQLQ